MNSKSFFIFNEYVLCLLFLLSGLNSFAQTSQYSSPRTYREYTSPYNLGVIQQTMIYKQQQADQNRYLIDCEVEEILDTLDEIAELTDGFNQSQMNIIKKITRQLNESLQCDLSNGANARSIIKWLNKWHRYFRSWEDGDNSIGSDIGEYSSNISVKEYSGKVSVSKFAPILDSPDSNRGKRIAEVRKGSVTILEKVSNKNYYKVSYEGIIGYIWGAFIND